MCLGLIGPLFSFIGFCHGFSNRFEAFAPEKPHLQTNVPPELGDALGHVGALGL